MHNPMSHDMECALSLRVMHRMDVYLQGQLLMAGLLAWMSDRGLFFGKVGAGARASATTSD